MPLPTAEAALTQGRIRPLARDLLKGVRTKAVRLALAMGEVVQRAGPAFFAFAKKTLRVAANFWYAWENVKAVDALSC
jgi:hypothetical protein